MYSARVAYAQTLGQPPHRLRRGASPRQRALSWGVIGIVHVAILAALLIGKVTRQATPPEQALMVSLISTPAPMQASTPPAAPKTPPPKAPTLIASRAPSASAIAAAPVQETTLAPAPVVSAAPQQAAASAPELAIVPPSFSAAYLNNPGPQYPTASRRQREEGVVRLKVLVSAAGAPEQVMIERTSGFPNLDAAALDVVKKRWRFAPAKQGERPVSAWVTVPLSFNIKR